MTVVTFHLTAIASGIVTGFAMGITLEFTAAIILGVGFRITIGFGREIAHEIAAAISLGTALGITLGIAGAAGDAATGIAFGIALGFTLGLHFEVASGAPFGVVLGIPLGIFFGILGFVPFVIAFAVVLLRAYYHPLHVWFVWPEPHAQWYRPHPVAWDDLCALPFPGLHRLLVAYAENLPEAGNSEIDRLISSYPSQRTQALHARTTLLAREAGAQQDLARIDAIVASLPEGDKGFLREDVRGSKHDGGNCRGAATARCD